LEKELIKITSHFYRIFKLIKQKYTKMTKEEKYKKALDEILDIAGNVDEQDYHDMSEDLAEEQDSALCDIYKIAKDVLE